MFYIDLAAAFDNRHWGNKAANLAKAIARGERVPDGLVIRNAALSLFLKDAELTSRVDSFLHECYPEDHVIAQLQYEALCSALLSAPFSAILKSEIEPLARLHLAKSPTGLAVRSSSANEDTPRASFAGIYASYLGITDLDDLWEKVRRVWYSAWSPRAIQYAGKMGVDLQPDQMAVIVQQMVPADSSGVIFTADPLSGNPWQFVLNATPGLAQALVDGTAPADRFILAWETGAVLEKQIVAKPTALMSGENGVQSVALTPDQANAPALADGMATAIAQMALRLDRAFDRRVDIEWAAVGEEIYLLQVRPIPALPGFFPHELSVEEAGWTWTPEERVWYATMAENERLVTPLFRHRWALDLWERWSAPGDIFPHHGGHERDFNGYRYTTEWQWYGHAHDRASTEAWLDIHEASLRSDWLAQLARVHQANQCAASLEASITQARDLIPVLSDFMEQEEQMQAAVWYAPQWLVFTCEYLLRAFLDEFAPGFPIGNLLQGLPCYSSQRTIAAQELGSAIDEDFVRQAFAEMAVQEIIPWLVKEHPGSLFLRDFEAFCWEFGMTPPSLPEQVSRGGQDTSSILFIIKNSLLQHAQDARGVVEACARQRHLAEVQAHLQIHQALAPALITRFDKLLAWAQFWVPALDDRKWHCAMSERLASLRYRTGALLTQEGILDNPTGILLFRVEDLIQAAKAGDVSGLGTLYLTRQHEYECNRRLAPPTYLGIPPEEQPPQPATENSPVAAIPPDTSSKKVLRGQGFAPGRARGIIRKVPDLNDASFWDSLTGEDILVCPQDRGDWWRRDWLSLFMVVKGLVTVQGAQLHHATQIARECGVPFVNLPANDYASLPDGARIEIDGAAGTIRLE